MLAFAVIAAILEIAEMILFARQKLHAAMYLASQILKMILWTGEFANLTLALAKFLRRPDLWRTPLFGIGEISVSLQTPPVQSYC
jgi:hypothetical protein